MLVERLRLVHQGSVGLRSNLACCLLLFVCLFVWYGLQDKNDFYIFKYLSIKRRRIFRNTLILYEIKISLPINKALLECSCTHSFMCSLWLLLYDNGRDE